MVVNGHGIVLGFFKYGDTSVIARIITKQHGLSSFIIQGVYRKKARISASMLQPFSLLEMVYYFKENRHIQKVKEVKPLPQLTGIQSSIVKSSLSIFGCEVLKKTLNNTEQDEPLYEWLFEKIIKLNNSSEPNTYWPHKFLIELAQLQGFGPSETEAGRFFHLREGVFTNIPMAERDSMNAEETQLFIELIRLNEVEPRGKMQRNQLLDKLVDFFSYQIGGFKDLKSLHVIRHVLS